MRNRGNYYSPLEQPISSQLANEACFLHHLYIGCMIKRIFDILQSGSLSSAIFISLEVDDLVENYMVYIYNAMIINY
jgi:uncharacterized membrane protein